MTPDRMDDLLDRALDTGVIPEDATAEERSELERLLAASGVLTTERQGIDAEAAAAKPVARARFERAIGDIAPEPGGRERPRARRWSRRSFGFGALAALAAVVAVGVLAIRPFNGAETVSALTVDDYVQIPGVVSATGDGTITVESEEFGQIEVLVSDLTSVVDGQQAAEPASLRPGQPVLVGGLVRRAHASNVQIDARTVARHTGPGGGPPRHGSLQELRNYREGLSGTITVLVLSPDGETAGVVLETGDGGRVLVRVARTTVERLIAARGSVIGLDVRVERGEDGAPFRLALVDSEPEPEPDDSGFVTISGVIENRRANAWLVRTEGGTVPAIIRPHSRILPGESGLSLERIRRGERAIGHAVTITGGIEAGTDRVIIDVAVLGPKAE